jgi:hypothetical protein
MGGFTYREKKLDRDDQKNRKSDEMRIEDFRKLIILAAKQNFPDASILHIFTRGTMSHHMFHARSLP